VNGWRNGFEHAEADEKEAAGVFELTDLGKRQ